MAFLNLRNNHLIYILHKDNIPVLEIGKVTSVSLPVPKYGNNSMYNDLVLDITVDVDGKQLNFLKIPSNSEIADFGNNIVLATSKDAMNSELVSMKQRSLDIINSVDYHLNVLSGCDEILKTLNPEIAEKQKQEQESRLLREEINSLKEMFQEFLKQMK